MNKRLKFRWRQRRVEITGKDKARFRQRLLRLSGRLKQDRYAFELFDPTNIQHCLGITLRSTLCFYGLEAKAVRHYDNRRRRRTQLILNLSCMRITRTNQKLRAPQSNTLKHATKANSGSE